MKEKIYSIIFVEGKINRKRMTKEYFQKYYTNLYNEIIKTFLDNNISFSEMLYLITHDMINPPKCIICENDVRFKKFSEGYSSYCSMKCLGLDKTVQGKREQTSIIKNGVKYALQSNEIKEKIKLTNIRRYGIEHPQKLTTIKEKTRQTNLLKYNVESHNQLDEVKNKKKETLLKKYGVDNPMKSEVIKEIVKNTNLKKYGVDNPNKSDEIKNKIRKTVKEKYDVEHYFNSNEFSLKKNRTLIKEYGVDNPMKSDVIKESVKKIKLEKYGDENFNNRIKSKETTIKKYGVDNISKSPEIILKIKKTNILNFIKKYSNLLNVNQNDIDIIGDYVTINNYCKKHDNFNISKSLLYSRLIWNKHENICTKCNPVSENKSIIELELKSFLMSLNIKLVNNDKSILDNKQELDFYLPEYKLAIEFNGLYWHSELFKDKNYHLNKTNLCNNKGIQLLHVYEDEWIYKKEIIKSIIKSKLNIIENNIYGRNTVIKEIDKSTTSDFLMLNHVQGAVPSEISIGLYYNNDLVSIMCFDTARKGLGNAKNSDKFFNLSRFCNKINTHVIGGASKLLKYFIKTYNPHEIITYADLRFSQGNLYKQIGFNEVHVNKPSYYYIANNQKQRYHRFNFRKKRIIELGWYDDNKTIDEILIEHNIYKIYNCGTIKFSLKLY
jgi:hypothetical protein